MKAKNAARASGASFLTIWIRPILGIFGAPHKVETPHAGAAGSRSHATRTRPAARRAQDLRRRGARVAAALAGIARGAAACRSHRARGEPARQVPAARLR